jgi:hypothetical protein
MTTKRDRVPALSLAWLVALSVLVAVPVLAHHSTAMFVLDQEITIEGTVTEMAWANPHSIFFLDAKPVDQPTVAVKNWSVETPSPAQLTRMGWQKDTIALGDKVKVRGFARKDGKAQILFIELTDDKGHHFSTKRTDYQGN